MYCLSSFRQGTSGKPFPLYSMTSYNLYQRRLPSVNPSASSPTRRSCRNRHSYKLDILLAAYPSTPSEIHTCIYTNHLRPPRLIIPTLPPSNQQYRKRSPRPTSSAQYHPHHAIHSQCKILFTASTPRQPNPGMMYTLRHAPAPPKKNGGRSHRAKLYALYQSANTPPTPQNPSKSKKIQQAPPNPRIP